MFRIDKDPTVRLFPDILLAIEGRHMDENKIGKCVNIEKHVAAAYLAEFAMARWLGIEALNFIIALENLERAPFHDRNDRHGSTADIRASVQRQ